MVKKILNGLFMLLAIFAIFFADLAASYILPSPFHHINIIFSCVVLFIVWWESGWVVWISFFLHLMVELYSTSPFGVVLVSSTVSVLTVYWLYKDVITNHSLPGAMLLGGIAIIIYRALYTFAMFFVVIVGYGQSYSLLFSIAPFLWELFFTSLTIVVLHILFNPLLSSIRVNKA